MRHAISALASLALASLALAGLVLAAGPALAEPADGRLKLIRDSATLRIAYRTDSQPFSYLDEQGQPTGYTIELCRRIAKSLEQQLNGPVAIQWVAVDTRTRFDAIVNGSADMECGSTTMSLSRMKIVDFSSVVFAESTGVLAKSGGGVFSFDSLAGKSIGVIAGTTNARAVRDQVARRKLAITTIEFADRQAGIAALARGELDAFADDKLTLLAAARAANLRDFGLLSEDLSFEPFAIMLPRGDWAFRLAVNTALSQIFRSGEIVELYTRYFGDAGPGASSWAGMVFIFGGLPE
jgi:glutamate/aspartate transport system substrate-binding protein